MAQNSRRLGMLGLGLLGGALAERFLKAGFSVTGYDPVPACRQRLEELGGLSAESAAGVASRSRRIVFCLPDSSVTAAVLSEIEPVLKPGALIVDSTTGDPEEIAAFGERLRELRVGYVDATVGGSSAVVKVGAATVMAGGLASDFEACSDLFAAFASRTFHIGPCGAGTLMKLVNNLVLGLNRAALAEGLAFAGACGLDQGQVLEVLKAGPAYSRAMDSKGAKMLCGDFTPEARLSQHLKDVRLILRSAARYGARVPLSTLHREILEAAEAAGFGAADNSAIIRAFDPERR